MKLSALAIGAAAGLASAAVVQPTSVCDKSAFKDSSLLSEIPSFVEYCDVEFPVTTSVCKGKTITDVTTSTVHETKTKTLAPFTKTLTTGTEGRATVTKIVTPLPDIVFASPTTVIVPLTVSYNCSTSEQAAKRAVGVAVSASVGLTYDGSLPTGTAKVGAKVTSALSSYKSAFAKLKASKSAQSSYAKTMCGCVETVPVCTPSIEHKTVPTTVTRTITTQKTATHDVKNTLVETVTTITTKKRETETVSASLHFTHTNTVSVCATAAVEASVGVSVSISASIKHPTTSSSSSSTTTSKPAASTTHHVII